MSKFVQQKLKAVAELQAERNAVYKDVYKRQGAIMSLMFPEGIVFEEKDDKDWNRMGIMFKIIDKVIRYNSQFLDGGHQDSLDDIIAYAAMLLEIDSEDVS